MKSIFTTFSFLLLSFTLISQDLKLSLNSGNFKLKQSISIDSLEIDQYRLIYFQNIPSDVEKKELKDLGVDILYYLPKNIFVVYIKNELSQDIFQKYNIISVNKIRSEYKIDSKLKESSFPEWCIKDGELHVKVLFYINVDFVNCVNELDLIANNLEFINELSKYAIISLDPMELQQVSALSFVSYIEPIDPPAEPENYSGRTLHRSNTINTNFVGGRKYNGDGVNVMMHDDG